MIPRDDYGSGHGTRSGDGFGDGNDVSVECFADHYGHGNHLRNGNGICEPRDDDSIFAILKDGEKP